MSSDPSPFADLPAALVAEVIGHATEAGHQLLNTFQHIRSERHNFRALLEKNGLIEHESAYGCPPAPTTCGTDGSYAIERLLSADFAAAAAVAVEGLTPPSETRHWADPHHSSFIAVESHHEKTATIIRSVMLGEELLLAVDAPHDLIMLDSTLTLPIIYFNQALNALSDTDSLKCSCEFEQRADHYIEAYVEVLESPRTDRNYVALPKYTTRREVGESVGWSGEHDDRGLLTMLLRPSELTVPLRLERPASAWHVNMTRLTNRMGEAWAKDMTERIIDRIHDIHVCYYKPQPWLPALRVELPGGVAQNRHRLGVVLQGLKHQCATGAMLEPYPLYLADRMVKSLARAIPTFRQVASQQIAETYSGDIGDVFFAMHGYRSESGA